VAQLRRHWIAPMVASLMSQNVDNFLLQPIDASVSTINNPHFHPLAQSAGAVDDALTGMEQSCWDEIFILLPPISQPPLRLIHNNAAAAQIGP